MSGYNWQKHVRGGGSRGGRRGRNRGNYTQRDSNYNNDDYEMNHNNNNNYNNHKNQSNQGNYDDYDDYNDNYDYNNRNRQARTDSAESLRRKLISYEGKPWNFYKDLRFIEWQYHSFSLWFDRVQTDPFAPPTNLRIRVPMSIANIPKEYYSNNIRNIACCDYLTRQFGIICRDEGYDIKSKNRGWHGKKGGDLSINRPGQHVIERSSINITNNYIEARFTCSLPGRGRKIEGRWCADIMLNKIPYVIENSLLIKSLRKKEFMNHIISVEDQEYLRNNMLNNMGLAAFVPNGAILPRMSGVDDRPMGREAVPFICDRNDPLYREIEININNNHRKLAGLGIPKGITLIVGGGFHGKSTLLEALQYGVYNHIPGDGREFVSTLSNGVKIRAEDGRNIANVNISPFINNLPHKKSTSNFYTSDASGSTSQAANICEALEIGCNLLLIDEDTCATNFMIRDRNMQLLVSSNKEPITPFISKIRAMYTELNVSSILVVGGCGAYFQVADHVVMMDNYLPRNLTQRAKEIANSSEFLATSGISDINNNNNNINGNNNNESKENGNLIFEYKNFGDISERYPIPASIDARANKGIIKMKVSDKFRIGFGRQDIDVSSVAQIVEKGQSKAIAKCLVYIAQNICKNGQRNVSLRQIMEELDNNVLNGLDEVNNVQNAMYGGELSHDLVRPRRYEIVAALNRLRTLKIKTFNENNIDKQNNNGYYATNSNYTTTTVSDMGIDINHNVHNNNNNNNNMSNMSNTNNGIDNRMDNTINNSHDVDMNEGEITANSGNNNSTPTSGGFRPHMQQNTQQGYNQPTQQIQQQVVQRNTPQGSTQVTQQRSPQMPQRHHGPRPPQVQQQQVQHHSPQQQRQAIQQQQQQQVPRQPQRPPMRQQAPQGSYAARAQRQQQQQQQIQGYSNNKGHGDYGRY